MKIFNDSENYTSSLEEDFVDETDNEDDLLKEEETVLLPPIPAAVKKKRRLLSPSGPLTPAIIKVLKQHGRPMKVTEVFDELQASGYVWVTETPMQALYARLRYMPKSFRVIRISNAKYTLSSASSAN